MPQVDFIYGLDSRYSYLAATQIARIEAEAGVAFRWRPISSLSLMERRVDNPFQEGAGGQYDWDYRRRDAEAWAAFYRVPFRDPVGRLTADRLLPALAALAAGRQELEVPMSQRLFRLGFVDDIATFGREEIMAEAQAEGLDMDRFQRDLVDSTLLAQHDADVARAVDQGVFGMPTFLLEDGRMFWGNDRLVLLEAALNGKL